MPVGVAEAGWNILNTLHTKVSLSMGLSFKDIYIGEFLSSDDGKRTPVREHWYKAKVAGETGFSFPGGGGSMEPSGRTPPPPKRGSIDGTPKIPKKPARGRPWFQWRWYLCLRTQGPRLIPATCM